MQFNNYNLYSMLSDVETKTQADLLKVNNVIEMLYKYR